MEKEAVVRHIANIMPLLFVYLGTFYNDMKALVSLLTSLFTARQIGGCVTAADAKIPALLRTWKASTTSQYVYPLVYKFDNHGVCANASMTYFRIIIIQLLLCVSAPVRVSLLFFNE